MQCASCKLYIAINGLRWCEKLHTHIYLSYNYIATELDIFLSFIFPYMRYACTVTFKSLTFCEWKPPEKGFCNFFWDSLTSFLKSLSWQRKLGDENFLDSKVIINSVNLMSFKITVDVERFACSQFQPYWSFCRNTFTLP